MSGNIGMFFGKYDKYLRKNFCPSRSSCRLDRKNPKKIVKTMI